MVFVPIGEVPEAIARIARPLDELVELVGDARLVLIGGASHGTHEFYELRAALTRKLIADRGFTAVVVEADWPDALRVDRYVRGHGDDDTAAAALEGFDRFPRWMWRNTEVAEFVEWLHAHDARRPPEARVGFYGMDLFSMRASSAAVLAYLEDVEPEAADRWREHHARFDHAATDAQPHGLPPRDPPDLGLDPRSVDEVVAQLVARQARAAARSGRSPSGEAWFEAMQHARIARNAEQYYRTMFVGRTEAWNLRDTHMADTIDMLARHLGTPAAPARLVVWAHNAHVGDARASELRDEGQLTVGQLLRQRHPEQVALIGLTTDRGTVECAHDWDEPGLRERVRPSLPGSWEELFHEAGVLRFAMTSAALKQVVGERAQRLHRTIGVVYRPSTERRSHYFHTRIADQYDVIVHLDETHAVHPLDRPAPAPPPTPTPDHEPPETFPTGM